MNPAYKSEVGVMGPMMVRKDVTSRRVAAVQAGLLVVAVAALGVAPVLLQPALAQSVEAPAPAAARAAKSKVKAAAKSNDAAAASPDEAAASPQAKSGKRDPAAAARTIDAGIKQLQSGKADQAVATLSTVISGGNLPASIMAKALYNRGLAYRQQSKPAQAISDLTSALWLKGGLDESDRKAALEARSEAYRQAGLPDQSGGSGSAAPAPVKTATIANARAPAALATGSISSAPQQAPAAAAALTHEPAPAKPSSAGGFLASLFGGSSVPDPAPARQPTAESATPTAAKSDIGQPWSSATAVKNGAKSAAPPTRVASAVPPPVISQAPAAQPAATGGNWRARIALVRSADEAKAIADRLRSEFAPALGQREAVVDQATFGNMGTFFQVRVGPYATPEEAQGFCASVKKGRGLDCVPVTQ